MFLSDVRKRCTSSHTSSSHDRNESECLMGTRRQCPLVRARWDGHRTSDT